MYINVSLEAVGSRKWVSMSYYDTIEVVKTTLGKHLLKNDIWIFVCGRYQIKNIEIASFKIEHLKK